ncbi:MAG: class I SAM-dependent RNA methyltransferase [Clostridia bacterium]|nr:class I SAM-dependent RNA methyltransferase [Clostridia bacterium]
MDMTFVAPCLFGLERALGAEMDALGLNRTDTMDGRVSFTGGAQDCAKANIGLRCAERIYLRLGQFEARSFTELFDGTAALPWEDFIGPNDAFPVKGHAVRSQLFSVPDCQSIVKKAVVKRLQQAYRKDWFEETGIRYQIEFFLFKDVAALMIDTTGAPLHKRGYRPESGVAPLRETLAAGLIYESRLRTDNMLWDPFCGSGTIAIEGTMIQLGIAPGLRRPFDGEMFPWLGKVPFDREREAAAARAVRIPDLKNRASDIDPSVLPVAEENARRAGVADHVEFFAADARTIQKPDCRGTIVCNPPYGERMMTVEQAERLYRETGRNFASFAPWQIYVLTASERFETLYGRKADKVRKLYNGMIPCYLYAFFRPASDGRAKPGRKNR